MKNRVSVKSIDEASEKIADVVKNTPLEFSKRLSDRYQAKVYIKREDLQEVRSYKIRGAYNLMQNLGANDLKKGVVAASAGNHAQGVAYACSRMKIKGVIFMPEVTPLQKINRVREFGGKWIEVRIFGNSFDESCQEAIKYSRTTGAKFIHPFADELVISGQGTIAKEVVDSLNSTPDYCFVPVGGGGLISGISTYLKTKNKNAKIVGCEPNGAPSMYKSLKKRKVVRLEKIEKFVDGAAVAEVDKLTFEITSKNVEQVKPIPEGKICTTMIELYQNEGIIAEPAGALSISALDYYKDEIKGKTVVCILSGGNNDILRYPEIMERSLLYEGLKHYFLVEFAQKPGQLREFLNNALGPTDDIVRFEYVKKTSKEMGPALIGLEFQDKDDYPKLQKKMDKIGLKYTVVNSDNLLASYLI